MKQKVTKHTLQIANNPNLTAEAKDCPFPIALIPNYMGINLCSVKEIEWIIQDDGQLTDIHITFIPSEE